MIDVNLNQKAKVKIIGTFEGEVKNLNKDCTGRCITTEKYNFSEFAIYIIDESGNAQGIMNLGTRGNVICGNTRDKHAFTALTVENTGQEMVITDSRGFKLAYSLDFKYIAANGIKEENRGG